MNASVAKPVDPFLTLVKKAMRNLVKRCVNKLKNARRVATRYDKTAESFLTFIDITSIRPGLRHLST